MLRVDYGTLEFLGRLDDTRILKSARKIGCSKMNSFELGLCLTVNFLVFLQLQELATSLTELWNLMDTPMEEQNLFDHVTCNISASVDEVTVPGALAIDIIEQVSHLHPT